MKYSAILFDLDGTLTDSARLFITAAKRGLGSMGLTIQHEIVMDWHHKHAPFEYLLTEHGHDAAQATVLEQVIFEKFDEILSVESQWMAGAEETVKALHKRGIPMAIVSNSFDSLVDTIDKVLPLKHYFSVIITASTTLERRKPDPYGLFLATEKLGVHPKDCLFVGDQRFDIMAANGAGMQDCLFVGPHTHPDTELIATKCIYTLPDLLKIID